MRVPNPTYTGANLVFYEVSVEQPGGHCRIGTLMTHFNGLPGNDKGPSCATQIAIPSDAWIASIANSLCYCKEQDCVDLHQHHVLGFSEIDKLAIQALWICTKIDAQRLPRQAQAQDIVPTEHAWICGAGLCGKSNGRKWRNT